VVTSPYGKLPDGTAVELYTITNAAGVEARVITYGGIIVSLKVPDRTGALDDVVRALAVSSDRRQSFGNGTQFSRHDRLPT
jgi:aldose 1-epimerase